MVLPLARQASSGSEKSTDSFTAAIVQAHALKAPQSDSVPREQVVTTTIKCKAAPGVVALIGQQGLYQEAQAWLSRPYGCESMPEAMKFFNLRLEERRKSEQLKEWQKLRATPKKMLLSVIKKAPFKVQPYHKHRSTWIVPALQFEMTCPLMAILEKSTGLWAAREFLC